MRRRLPGSQILLLALSLSLSTVALAKTSVSVSPEKIREIVQSSDILEEEYKQQVYAAFQNDVASVSLFRHPEASRADCKIDAVLLARKIIALSPTGIKLVRCVFYDYDRQNEFWEVEVRPRLINAFAKGEIGEQELMNSILLTEDKQSNPLSAKLANLSYSGIIDLDAVCRGAYEEKRLAIHLRLEELEKQKVSLLHFREDFLRVEDAARRGKDSTLLAQINTLNSALDAYVDELTKTGQLQKQELRRSKNSIAGSGNSNKGNISK